jgi:hypothetical protein
MRIQLQNGRRVEVLIERKEFATTWLRCGKHLVGFSDAQLADVDLALRRIETISGHEFYLGEIADLEKWWGVVTADLESEFQQHELRGMQRPALAVGRPRASRFVPRRSDRV